jgi:hypothetical protein
MILPVNVDLDLPTEVLVEQLLASGVYDDEEDARAVIEILKDPDAPPLE